MGMIGQPKKEEIHWEDLPMEAHPIAAPQTAEPETQAEETPELPDWLNPNISPAEEPATVPVRVSPAQDPQGTDQ